MQMVPSISYFLLPHWSRVFTTGSVDISLIHLHDSYEHRSKSIYNHEICDFVQSSISYFQVKVERLYLMLRNIQSMISLNTYPSPTENTVRPVSKWTDAFDHYVCSFKTVESLLDGHWFCCAKWGKGLVVVDSSWCSKNPKLVKLSWVTKRQLTVYL